MNQSSFWGLSAGAWSALAAWVALVFALFAALLAWWQLREARRLRLEQARPYVVVFMRSSAVDPQLVDVVVRNFGPTAAFDVVAQFEPEPRRTDGFGGTEAVWLPPAIPVLAPGQEWWTLWDFGRERQDSGLPDKHEVSVRWKDSRGAPDKSESVLDWGQYQGRRWTVQKTIHDVAKELVEIRKHLDAAREGVGRGLAVYVRDGHARDEELGLAARKADAEHSKFLARERRDGADGQPSDA